VHPRNPHSTSFAPVYILRGAECTDTGCRSRRDSAEANLWGQRKAQQQDNELAGFWALLFVGIALIK